MKINAILHHFLFHSTWVDPATTVDRIIAGEPGADVERCLVTWMPSMKALHYLVEHDFRLLVCHEPTFWNHDLDQPVPGDQMGEEKMTFIQQHRLTILRLHDCWDRWPEVGIPWAWAKFLVLGDQPGEISSDGFQHRYDIDALPLGVFASQVAGRCRALGESAVQLIGDPSRTVAHIGIGTGCGCDIPTFQAIGCDCSIVCDDGSLYWQGIQKAEDQGHPVIRVNHGTSEEPGMLSLAEYINSHLDGLQAEYLPHRCTYQLVSSDSSLIDGNAYSG